MTPDGLTGLTPEMYDRYFTLLFSTGQELSASNIAMAIEGTDTSVTVLGLADVGIYLEEGYTPCYADDRDNYIDIILHVTGDATVLETTLISFRSFSQQPGLYNPGGPGPTPFDSIRHVAPAVEQIYPIDVDLNRVREVAYCVHQDGSDTTDIATCNQWLAAGEMEQFELGQLFPEQLQQIAAAIAGAIGGGDSGMGGEDVSEAPSEGPDERASEEPTATPATDGDSAAPSPGEDDSASPTYIFSLVGVIVVGWNIMTLF